MAALCLLVSLVGLPRGARGGDGTRVLSPEGTEALAQALRYEAAGQELADGLLITSIRVDPLIVELGLEDRRGGPARRLRATHSANPRPPADRLLFDGPQTLLLSSAEDAERLRRAAELVGPLLQSLPWLAHGRGGSSSSAAAPVPVPGISGAYVAVLWILLLLGALLFVRAARAAAREGALRVPVWQLVAVTGVALAVRLLWSFPWPVAHVEVARALPGTSGDVELLPLLVAPFLGLGLGTNDLLLSSVVNGACSVLAAPLLLLLGSAWLGPRAGWFAALLQAATPLAVRFALTTGALVAATTLLLLAMTATELLARRPRTGVALAASLAWALAVHARPESPGYLAGLLLWFLLDRRLRGALRAPRIALPFLLPLLAALGLELVLSARAPAAAYGVSPWAAAYWESLRPYAWTLFFDPGQHHPVVTGLWLAGIVVVKRGRARCLLVVMGFVLPLLLAALSASLGTWDGAHPIVVGNFRYVLPGQPLLLLLAAASLAALWNGTRSVVRERAAERCRRAAAGTLLAAALLGVVLAPGAHRVPSPLQLEHRFLSGELGRVEAGSIVVVMGAGDMSLNVAEQVVYHLGAAWGWRRPDGGVGLAHRHVVDLDELGRRTGELGERAVYYYRGWSEYLAQGTDAFRWRRALSAAGWAPAAPAICEEHRTLAVPVHRDGRMTLCLQRLTRREIVREVP